MGPTTLSPGDTAPSAAAPAWEAPDDPYPSSDRVALLALISIPAVLVAVVLAVMVGAWWVGAVLVVMWGVKTWLDASGRDPVMLRRLGARALAAHEAPRLRNIAEGLARDLKVPAPALYVLPEGGPNAFVRRTRPGGSVAITQALLDTYTRTELEAVVAHCLLRIRSEAFVYANLAARWSGLGAGLAPRVGRGDDIATCALTRYPPALAAALSKADGKVKLYSPLWFVSGASSHQPTAERIAAISQL